MLSYHAQVVFAALCFKRGVAQLSVTFPLNSQLPPVAVANQAFSFAFSPDTFSSRFSSIDYELTSAPTWLRLNGKTRTLSGTPSFEDVGDVQVEIKAYEGGGIATAVVTLVVIEYNNVSGNQDILVQRLRSTGSLSAPSTLLLRPSTYFDLDFGNTIFQGVGDSTQYYAVSTDNTPLPAWISFDPGRVSFSGTTPSLLTPQASPQTYMFAVTASQVAGFSQSALTFSISVTNHILVFTQPLQQVNVAAGDSVYVPPLIDFLRRDDQPVARSAIASISSNQPTWLTLNTTDVSFKGSSPIDLKDPLFRVSVIDDQNNLASTDVQLLLSGNPRESPSEVYLGTVNGTAGDYFNYNFAGLNDGRSGDQYDVDLGSAGSWLIFVQPNSTLQGLVPVGTRTESLNVSVSILEDNKTIQIAYLTIMILGADSLPVPSTSPSDNRSTSSTAATAGAVPPGGTSSYDTGSRRKALTLIITIPLLSVFAICLICYFLLKRSRRKRNQALMHPNEPQRVRRSQNSGNVVVLAQSQTQSEFEEMTERGSPAPRIDLSWTKHPIQRVRRVTNADEGPVGSPETRYSWDEILLDLGDSHISLDSSKLAAIAIVDESNQKPLKPRRDKELAILSLASPLASPLATSRPPRHAGLRSTFGQQTQAPQFNGRRTSGLGHGTSLRNSTLDLNRMTLRQVPVSPILEKQGLMSDARGSQWASSHTQQSNFIINQVLYAANRGRTKAKGKRKASPVSSGSMYDDDDHVVSSSDKSSQKQRHSTLFLNMTGDDDDWVTERSMANSSIRAFRHGEEDPLPMVHGVNNERYGTKCWREQPPRGQPIATIDSRSSRSRSSEQSQSHSLRFI